MDDLINDIRRQETRTIAESRNGVANARKSRLPLPAFLIDLDHRQSIGMTMIGREEKNTDDSEGKKKKRGPFN